MLNIVHNISFRIENVKIEQQREVRCRQETLKVGRTGRDCRAHRQIDNHMECRGGERKRETTTAKPKGTPYSNVATGQQ